MNLSAAFLMAALFLTIATVINNNNYNTTHDIQWGYITIATALTAFGCAIFGWFTMNENRWPKPKEKSV